MLGLRTIGAVTLAVTLAVAAAACVPPPTQLIPPQVVRVDQSYQCNETAAEPDPERCVFWRTSGGAVFYGPFRMVALPPFGDDVIIPPPVTEGP